VRNSIFQALFGKDPVNPFQHTKTRIPETEVVFQAGQLAWSDNSVIAKVTGITDPKGRAFSLEVTVFMNGKEKVEAFATDLKDLDSFEKVNDFINECVKLWSHALRSLGGRPDKLSRVDVRFYLEQTYREILEREEYPPDNAEQPSSPSGFMPVEEMNGKTRVANDKRTSQTKQRRRGN
jgi:hypothetical protein